MVAEMSMPDKPLYRRGLLSRVVFAHVGELVSRGVRARLEEDDLPPLPPASRSGPRALTALPPRNVRSPAAIHRRGHAS
jgi:hypothetical protein